MYIDNEGAKFSLTKEYSSALAVTAICAFTAPFWTPATSCVGIAVFLQLQILQAILPGKSIAPSERIDEYSWRESP